MKASRLNLVVGGLALALSLAVQSAYAGEGSQSKPAQAPQAEPTADDLKKSGERGLIFNTVNTGVGAGATAPSPAAPLIRTTPVVKPITDATPGVKQVLPKHKQPRTVTASTSSKHVKSPIHSEKVKPVSTAVQAQASSSNPNVATVSHETTAGPMVVKAWLNKSGSKPTYKVGEKMTINVAASEDCNLMVFDFDGTNSLKQIFPNEYQPNGVVKAGETIIIGGPDSPFDYQVGGSGGQERIFVYAYPSNNSASPLTVAMLPAAHSPFRSAEMTLDKYRELVNKSKIFFSREVKVVPKSGFKPVSDTSGNAPNKLELTFQVQP
jgi:hypothetical protein